MGHGGVKYRASVGALCHIGGEVLDITSSVW